MDIKPGDGLVFDSGKPEQAEPGGTVFRVRHCSQTKATKHGQKLRAGSEPEETDGGAASASRTKSEMQLEMRGDAFKADQVKVMQTHMLH